MDLYLRVQVGDSFSTRVTAVGPPMSRCRDTSTPASMCPQNDLSTESRDTKNLRVASRSRGGVCVEKDLPCCGM